MIFFLLLAYASSWLIYPPSLDPRKHRPHVLTGIIYFDDDLGPCEFNDAAMPPLYIQTGQILPVIWPSFQQKGGFVRLALSNDLNKLNESVVKITCFGSTYPSEHCCPGNQSSHSDVETYQTWLQIPNNLNSGIYYLQWTGLMGNWTLPSYSCSRLYIDNPKLAQMNFSTTPQTPQNVTVPVCKREGGPGSYLLLKNILFGNFLYGQEPAQLPSLPNCETNCTSKPVDRYIWRLLPYGKSTQPKKDLNILEQKGKNQTDINQLKQEIKKASILDLSSDIEFQFVHRHLLAVTFFNQKIDQIQQWTVYLLFPSGNILTLSEYFKMDSDEMPVKVATDIQYKGSQLTASDLGIEVLFEYIYIYPLLKQYTIKLSVLNPPPFGKPFIIMVEIVNVLWNFKAGETIQNSVQYGTKVQVPPGKAFNVTYLTTTNDILVLPANVSLWLVGQEKQVAVDQVYFFAWFSDLTLPNSTYIGSR